MKAAPKAGQQNSFMNMLFNVIGVGLVLLSGRQVFSAIYMQHNLTEYGYGYVAGKAALFFIASVMLGLAIIQHLRKL